MIIVLTSAVLALVGLALLTGGAWLIVLGGSWFYAFIGAMFLVTAVLLYRRKGAALAIYGILVLASIIWAVWEVGFDWWQLAPRGGVIVVFGLWLLTPWIRRGLVTDRAAGRRPDRWPLAVPVLVSVAVAVYAMTIDPHDMAGTLPQRAVASAALGGNVPDGEWHQYGRTPYGQRYSPLDQINAENVSRLKLAWQYQTGDVKLPDDVSETTYQVTPLKVGDTLYLCTPHNWAIALDARTGREKWKYIAESGLNPDRQHQTCRGVTYWVDPQAATGTPCATQVFLPTSDARLIALDAATGEVCTGFADQGTLHLEAGMKYNPAGYYYSTSPPVVVDGRLIIGGAVNDNYSIHAQSGVIRAFDARTGTLLWNWDSGNPDETAPLAPGETYTTNSPNSWSVFSVDEGLGLVYIPLGNQVPDQLGMGRSPSVERFSSSIVALDIATGQVRWVRQTVHHDLWDMDVPAQPVLFDLTRPDGTVVPALVGPTKQGDIYVLDRRSGEPIIPVREVPAPGGTIPEDFSAPTQPISDLTFSPPPLRERDMWGITLFDQLACRIEFHRYRYEGRYTPPSVQGTIVYPGNFGVFNWGSVAVDPERQVMFGMPTYLAFISRLVPAAEIPPKGNEKGSEQGLNRNEGAPYGVYMGPFLGPLDIPCQAPPWGYVAGVDLLTGKIAYKHKNGTVYDMTPLPLPFKLGVPGIGGPLLTRGGVAFLAAAVDDYLRAYDVTDGRQLWEARLPAGGQSTPMTYMQDGRQYVVIVAGGHGSIGTKPGDFVLAYTLEGSEAPAPAQSASIPWLVTPAAAQTAPPDAQGLPPSTAPPVGSPSQAAPPGPSLPEATPQRAADSCSSGPAGVAVTDCTGGVLDPLGPIGQGNRTILLNALAVMLVIVIPTMAATVWFAWWFRASNRKSRYDPDFTYSGRIEMIVWSIPTLTILFIGGLIYYGSHDLDPRKPLASDRPPLEVQVVALDWKWLFIYPQQGIAAVNELVIPAGTPVRFRLTSASVMNVFFVPQLGTMIYAMNGMESELNLQADKEAVLYGQSAHYSGAGFPDMNFAVRAVAPPAFEAWADGVKTGGRVLDAQAYTALSRQSQNVAPFTFGSVPTGLFDAIVRQALPPAPGPGTGRGGDRNVHPVPPSETSGNALSAPAGHAHEDG